LLTWIEADPSRSTALGAASKGCLGGIRSNDALENDFIGKTRAWCWRYWVWIWWTQLVYAITSVELCYIFFSQIPRLAGLMFFLHISSPTVKHMKRYFWLKFYLY